MKAPTEPRRCCPCRLTERELFEGHGLRYPQPPEALFTARLARPTTPATSHAVQADPLEVLRTLGRTEARLTIGGRRL